MTRFALIAAPALLVLALVGCAAQPTTTPVPEAPVSAECEQVTVVVDFGVLDEPSIRECTAAGPALDVLDEAGLATEGTADYGNQVVCRVNNEPSPEETVTVEGEEPFKEACLTFNSVAYWALWAKTAADGEWEYAQEGVSTLELENGQSLGLVYTAGTDSTPPQD